MRATISTHYKLRLALMFFMLAGFGGWFIYDGFVTYPREAEVYKVWSELDPAERAIEWPKIAEKMGVSDSTKDPKRRTSEGMFSDAGVQKLLGFAVLPIGLMFGWLLLRTLSQWVELREDGVHASTGANVPWEELIEIDNTRWPSKGISIVKGQQGTLVLDDWKYDTDVTRVILETVEENLGDDKIRGERSTKKAGDGSDDSEGDKSGSKTNESLEAAREEADEEKAEAAQADAHADTAATDESPRASA